MKRILLLFFFSYLSAGVCSSKNEVSKPQEVKKVVQTSKPESRTKSPIILKKKLNYQKSKAELKPVYPTRSPKKIRGYYQRTTYYETVFYK